MNNIFLAKNLSLQQQSTTSNTETTFEITAIQSLMRNEGNISTRQYKNRSHTIIWLTKGSGYIKVAKKTHLLDADLVYCCSADRIENIFVEPDSEGFLFSFNADFVNLKENNFYFLFNNEPAENNSQINIIKIEEEARLEMLDVVNNLSKEFYNAFFLRSEVLRNLLKTFLIYLRRHLEKKYEANTGIFNVELVRRFYNLIENNVENKMFVSQYAALLNLSPNHLNFIIKKYSGQTVSYHIQQKIVFEAKRKAECEHASMKEIAYFLGFEDSSHFSKYFKKVTGNCFRNYKREISTVV